MDRKYPSAISLIVAAMFLIIPINALATTYFVSSSSGNDTNDGLSSVTDGTHGPWKTINKIHNRSFSAGDSILFKRGDSWNERLIVFFSGNNNSPLVYGAYGTGDMPLINCADKITEWTLFDQNKNIWVAQINTTIKSVSQVFVNDKRQTLSRWPNSGWNTIDATASDGLSLHSKSLTQPDNYWNGTTLVIRSCMWSIDTKPITTSSGAAQTLKWDTALPYSVFATKGYGYYIENKFEELDLPGEYYFNASTHQLYLALEKGTIPEKQTIEIAARDNGVYINQKNHVTISNLKIVKAAINGILCYNSNNVKVLNCNTSNSKKDGISYYSSSGADLWLKENTISDVDEGHGISVVNSARTEIANNRITDIASDFTSPRQGGGIYMRGTENSRVDKNTITNTGGHGMHLANGPVNVSGNFLSNCVLIIQDNGAIYLNGNHTGSFVEYNRIENCPGNNDGTPDSGGPGSTVGLYSDETAFGAVFRYNLIVRCAYGIHIHKSYNTHVFNNTFYDNRYAAVSLQERANNQMYGNNVKNNLCYALNPSAYTLIIRRFSTSDKPIGTFDNNLYYNPGTASSIAYIKDKNSIFSLSAWQTKTETDSGNDLHSLSVNPLLVDGAKADLHLQSSSPCIDSGTSVGASADFDGLAVPWGKAPDIGAFEYSVGTGANQIKMQPSRLVNFPNPFQQKTTIQFDVEYEGTVTLKIFDLNGKTVGTLIDRELSPGKYLEIWDPTGLPVGVYLIKMETSKACGIAKAYLVN